MKWKSGSLGAVLVVGAVGLAVTLAWAARADANIPVTLSGNLPYDVDRSKLRELVQKFDDLTQQKDAGAQAKLNEAHRMFAVLAWQAFIALNWPANPEGNPSESANIADTDAPRVWEFWRPSASIFLANGQQPAPTTPGEQWKTSEGTYYWKSAWRQHTTAASNLEAFSGPLVDQNGNWVRYQIRVNEEEFNYILKNELYSQDGQVRFSHLPQDNQVELPLNDGTKHGAIEIKLAWKQLGPTDDPTHFLTREISAQVSEPYGPDGKPVKPSTFLAGLVGMHISMRTQSSPEWVWSTFEHVDNVPEDSAQKYPGRHFNFFNPDKSEPVNVLPTPNAIVNPATGGLEIVNNPTVDPKKPGVQPDHWVESLTKIPVQVARIKVPTQGILNPYDEDLGQVTAGINQEFQNLLRQQKSVFQYYKLIDTQWPLHPNAPAFAGGEGSAPQSITHKTPGDMIPVFLVNTTMETYFQKGKQPAGSLEQDDRLIGSAPPIDSTQVVGTESCVGCHYSSGIAIGFKQDPQTGKEIVNSQGIPTPIFGENNHFGKTGNASFSWMLQQEPQAKPRDVKSSEVVVQ